jgi:hypothetical protein
MARTRNWWLPATSPLYVRGEVQAAKGAVSSEHWNVEPDSLAVKVNVAEVLLVGLAGRSPIVVSGGVVSGGGAVSIVQV